MSIKGVLEDLPLADVLQFIHLGQRSGTLYLWRNDIDRAEISFHLGKIVGAWTPGQVRLGDRLVAENLITADQLTDYLTRQRQDQEGRSIGQMLLDGGVVEREAIHRLLRAQIKDTVFQLVTWRRGQFQFEIDDISRLDDFAVDAQELLDLDLNTQMLLLEATRIFDERGRSDDAGAGSGDGAGAAEPAAAATPQPAGPVFAPFSRSTGGHRSPAGFGVAETQPMPAVVDSGSAAIRDDEPIRCQVVTKHPTLVAEIRAALGETSTRVVGVRLLEAGNRIPGERCSPLVVLDLRADGVDEEAIAGLARTRPAAPVIAVVDDPPSARRALEAGAVATVEPVARAIVHAFDNQARVLRRSSNGDGLEGGRLGFRRFRRVVTDVQSGLHSATMALSLMQVISESVERAVLFLVHGPRMVAVGAFGDSADGRPLAETTSGLQLEPEADCGLRRAYVDRKPLVLSFEEARLPSPFASLLGTPVSRQVVLFPVLGAEKAISVIYTDNGAREEGIEDIRILELATSQVGVAFENELMVQKLAGRGLAAALDDVLQDL